MDVWLVTKASGQGFSIEAGLADGEHHFDHHQKYSDQPSPCKDDRIPVVGANDVVEITHIDADTYCGLLRMGGKELPRVDLELMEKIDLNGSSDVYKFDPTLLYMVGVGQLARNLKFPRVRSTSIDVTEIIETMMTKTDKEIIQLGREATEKSENAYLKCKAAQSGKVGYWIVDSSDPLNPSRAYEDGIDVVVVHRKHYKSISIYCNPKSEYAFGGTKIAGIKFAGHPKASGSPRGVEFTEKNGWNVYNELVRLVSL